MTQKHAEQINQFETKEWNGADGYIFDASDTLVGHIDNTSESWLAVSLSEDFESIELYPEPENDDRYYELAALLEQKGYRVIDAEWIRKNSIQTTRSRT